MGSIFARSAAIAAAVALAVTLAACGGGDGGVTTAKASSGKVALFLPENKTTRYEAHDLPGFKQALKRDCPQCRLLYYNAGQDAARQQQQVDAAISEGAGVMVISAVDVSSARALVQRAKQAKIPVISYERLIPDAQIDYYLSYDNCRVGELQAKALVDRLKADGSPAGPIVKINGSPTDSNALEFKRCSTRVFREAGVRVAREYDTADWSPDKAQQEMEQAVAALGRAGFKGVYAANDGTAGGVIAAMTDAGVDPTKVPVTGQDAELAALQRIVAGRQFMTIYKAIQPESQISARVAVALLRKQQPPAGTVNRKVDNGAVKAPSMVFDPVVVTRDNVAGTVVKDKFWSARQICAGRYAQPCRKAGVDGA